MLGRKLIGILALALNLPETYFDDFVRTPGCLGRLLHYPAQPPDAASLGIGAHADIECLTFLAQGSDLSCLQVLNKSGQWIEAPPIPGTLVVNLGDMLCRCSNNRFLSTVHRVINKTGMERYSVPVFFGFCRSWQNGRCLNRDLITACEAYDAMIETAPTCLKEGEEVKFPPISAGECRRFDLCLGTDTERTY